MTRIDRRFAELKREGRAGLVTFITAGDPDYDTSLAIYTEEFSPARAQEIHQYQIRVLAKENPSR